MDSVGLCAPVRHGLTYINSYNSLSDSLLTGGSAAESRCKDTTFFQTAGNYFYKYAYNLSPVSTGIPVCRKKNAHLL